MLRIWYAIVSESSNVTQMDGTNTLKKTAADRRQNSHILKSTVACWCRLCVMQPLHPGAATKDAGKHCEPHIYLSLVLPELSPTQRTLVIANAAQGVTATLPGSSTLEGHRSEETKSSSNLRLPPPPPPFCCSACTAGAPSARGYWRWCASSTAARLGHVPAAAASAHHSSGKSMEKCWWRLQRTSRLSLRNSEHAVYAQAQRRRPHRWAVVTAAWQVFRLVADARHLDHNCANYGCGD